MKIDAQSHYFPPKFLKAIQGRQEEVWEKNVDLPISIENKKMADISVHLADMDVTGVETHVISCPIPIDRAERTLGLKLARIVNDEIASVVEKHRVRFVGLAILPLQDMAASLEELDRAVDELGLKGILLFSNVNRRPLDSFELMPLYKRVTELDIPVFIHPTLPVCLTGILDYGLPEKLGFLYDSSVAMLRLIYSGIYEKYPDLKILLPHLGSMIPYLMKRIDVPPKDLLLTPMKKQPSEYFREKVYVDTVSENPASYLCALQQLSIDKILYGSDYPFHDIRESIRSIENIPISEENKMKIFSENAKKLLRLQM